MNSCIKNLNDHCSLAIFVFAICILEFKAHPGLRINFPVEYNCEQLLVCCHLPKKTTPAVFSHFQKSVLKLSLFSKRLMHYRRNKQKFFLQFVKLIKLFWWVDSRTLETKSLDFLLKVILTVHSVSVFFDLSQGCALFYRLAPMFESDSFVVKVFGNVVFLKYLLV